MNTTPGLPPQGHTPDGGGRAGVDTMPEVVALTSITDRLVGVEREIREREAHRLELFAEALDLAATASSVLVGGKRQPCESSTPHGAEAELKYREIRAELATALCVSETTIERRMTRAWELVYRYPDVFDAYRVGVVSEQHVAVIIEAGRVIGAENDVETMVRRNGYVSQALTYAVSMTPAQVRQVVRRVAEQYARVSLDERHAVARRERRVRVFDAEDGMADVVAHLESPRVWWRV